MRLMHLPALLLALGTCQTQADPFITRDQNPLIANLGMPLPLPAELPHVASTRTDVVANWANTANSEMSGTESLLVDVESRELHVLVGHSFTERLAIRLQIPYRELNGGVLDSFIDGWHDAFGLPKGTRPLLPRDEFRLAYLRSASMRLDARPSSGLGDVTLGGAFQWWRTDRSAAALGLSIEAPTGKGLLGNGSWDLATQAAGKVATGTRAKMYWQLGLVRPGKDRDLAEWQKDWVASGLAAFEYSAGRSLRLKAQIDAHSAFYDSSLDLLGPAVILTLGGDYLFTSGWRLDIGVSEDVKVNASPDVNFYLALAKAL